MTSILKNVSIDKLHNIVNKYNKLYHKTVKMKPADVKKKKKNINSCKKYNDKDPRFKFGDIVRISKCKNIFCKRLCFKLVRKSFVYYKSLNYCYMGISHPACNVIVTSHLGLI